MKNDREFLSGVWDKVKILNDEEQLYHSAVIRDRLIMNHVRRDWAFFMIISLCIIVTLTILLSENILTFLCFTFLFTTFVWDEHLEKKIKRRNNTYEY